VFLSEPLNNLRRLGEAVSRASRKYTQVQNVTNSCFFRK
jgi:hypothetical protein